MSSAVYSNSRPPSARSASSLLTRRSYLIAYNSISLALWAILTLRAVLLIPLLSSHGQLYDLYRALQSFLAVTQSLALLEVVHSLSGLVRANFLTTAMQVISRLQVVWGVVGAFPEIVVQSRMYGVREHHYAGSKWGPLAYAGIVMAWGITECIRYGFFVWKEGMGDARMPTWLTWLRYVEFMSSRDGAILFCEVELTPEPTDITHSSSCIRSASPANVA
jgi:very-long-chain (3R)-3-hydroxyacyl-CoA dehydratase